jgi:hypothetical protein
MSTTTTTQPPVHHRRLRALLPLVIVSALAVAGGSAAVKPLTAAGAATNRPNRAAPAVVKTVDVQMLWNELSVLPVSEQQNIVAGLMPGVRARLRAVTEAAAGAAEGQ